MAKKKNQYPLGSIFLLLAMVFLFIAISKSDESDRKMVKVSKITVLGNQLLPEAEIIKMVKPATNDSFSRMELVSLKKQLENSPFIDEVILKINDPAELVINVKEFEPVAIFLNGKNMFYVNNRGELYPYRFLEKYEDLIILTGKETPKDHIIHNGLTMVNVLEEYPVVRHLVSEIHFEREKPYLILTRNAIQVNVDLKSLHENFVYLSAFIRSYGDMLNGKDVKSINLSYKNKIFISKRGLL